MTPELLCKLKEPYTKFGVAFFFFSMSICSSTFSSRYCMFKHLHPSLLYVKAYSPTDSTFTHYYFIFKHIHLLLLYVQAHSPAIVCSSTFTRHCMFKYIHPFQYMFKYHYCMLKHIHPLLEHSPSAIVCSSTFNHSFCICLFDLMLYVPVNNFQSCLDDFLSSWVEPVLSSR